MRSETWAPTASFERLIAKRSSDRSRFAEAICRLLLMALFCFASVVATAAPRIAVMTMQPGEIFFERFGHDAIVVVDARSGQATSYNFGFFDMEEPGFVDRFAHGDMQYYLVALPLQQDLSYYREVGRGVQLQWLDPPAQHPH